MQNSELTRQLRRLEGLIERTSSATNDIELQGHWGRYLCIVAAGFVENGLQTIYSEFASNAASPQVAHFVTKRLEQVTNPKAYRFTEVAATFSSTWEADLRAFLDRDGEERRNAIDSIMANRNRLAHGGSVGITVASVRTYLARCVEVLSFIEKQCAGGDPGPSWPAVNNRTK